MSEHMTSKEKTSDEARTELAEALARDLRQLDLVMAAAFVESQERELTRLRGLSHESAPLEPIKVPKGLLVRAFNCLNEIRQFDLTNSTWNELAGELNHEITRPRSNHEPSAPAENI